MVCHDFILPEFCKPCLFFSSFQFAKLIVPYHPYYKGVVKYKGVEYPGSHEALVDTETWDKVQAILASRINGTRNLKHPHFLKGSIFCAYCGERMMVSNEKKKDGTIYPYFVCSVRHSKRRKDCTTKAVLIDVVEKEIEKILFVIIFNAIFFLLPNHIIADFFII